jgi:hypothetical protein
MAFTLFWAHLYSHFPHQPMGDLGGDGVPPICEEKWHLLGVTIPWLVCFGVLFVLVCLCVYILPFACVCVFEMVF